MNPKITITVDAKNKAIASFDGIASVGAKIDVEVRGLPSGIVDFGAGDDWSGPSLRLRILDDDGNDIVRFPLEKKTSTKVSGGDQWTKTTASGADTYTNKTGTVVDFDTEGLREQFSGEAYDTSKSFGIILDSAVDKAELAVGKIKIRQWLTASVDDPTVLPNWTEIQEKLNTVDAKVEKPAGSTTATITITNTQGVTTTATVSDGVGGGDMKHSEFSEVTTLANATLNQVAAKVNELIGLLKPAVPMVLAMFGMCAFGDLGPTTQFGDVPPASTLSQVVMAGGGGGGGANTNVVNDLVATYVTTNAATTNLTARLDAKEEKFDTGIGLSKTNDVLLYKWTRTNPNFTMYTSSLPLEGEMEGVAGFTDKELLFPAYIQTASYPRQRAKVFSPTGMSYLWYVDGMSATYETERVNLLSANNAIVIATNSAKAYVDAKFVRKNLGIDLDAGDRIKWLALDGWVFNPYGDIGYALNWSSWEDPEHENSFRFRNKINNIYYSSYLRADGSPIVTSNMMNRAVMNAISNNCLIVTNDEWYGKKHIGDFWVEGEFGAKRDITIYANRYEDNPKLTFSTVWPANLYMEYYYDEPTDKAGISFATTSYFSPTTVTSTLLPDGSRVATSNMVNNVFSANADYALKNLTGAAVSIKSGEIGNEDMTADIAVTLDFSTAANHSGDCMLYLINATANDHDVVPTQTNNYTFVSTDLAKALTIGKATTNIVMFSRVKGDTVLVSKQEVK